MSSENYVVIRNREYLVYVVLGEPTTSPPWVEQAWAHIFDTLNPLIRVARDRAAVRSTQLRPGPLVSRPKRDLVWSHRMEQAGVKKWTHRENGRLLSGEEAEFVTCEVWAPSWSICEREGLSPDVYFAVRHEPGKQAVKFNSVCLLAVACDLEQIDGARKSAGSIASLLYAVLRAHCIRPWRSFGSLADGTYHNALNDLFVTGLFNLGPRHKASPSLLSLAGAWVSF